MVTFSNPAAKSQITNLDNYRAKFILKQNYLPKITTTTAMIKKKFISIAQ